MAQKPFYTSWPVILCTQSAVFNIISTLAYRFLKLSTSNQTQPKIATDPRFWPFFRWGITLDLTVSLTFYSVFKFYFFIELYWCYRRHTCAYHNCRRESLPYRNRKYIISECHGSIWLQPKLHIYLLWVGRVCFRCWSSSISYFQGFLSSWGKVLSCEWWVCKCTIIPCALLRS